MKVLALIPDFIEKPGGGLGEQFRHLYSHLKDKVEFYIIGHPERAESFKNFKYAINPIPICSHPCLSTAYGQAEYFLKALEFGVEFDIIHSFDWSTAYAGCLCSWHFKKPLVSSINLSPRLLSESKIPLAFEPNTLDGQHIEELMCHIEELGLLHSNRVIAVSDYYAGIFKPFGNKVRVIKNGIDEKSWVQKRKPNLPGKNKIKVCYIGRASSMKGIEIITNSKIPDDIDFYFVVSIKSAEAQPWEAVRKKRNNVNIFHIPGLYGQDKIDFLFSMDAVVMPSHHEPFGIVALEALISENILITTNTGGIAEITEGINILQIQNSVDLECAFEKLKSMSEDVKKSYCVEGAKKAKTFKWDVIADQYLKIYQDVLQEDFIPIKTTHMLDLDYDTLTNPDMGKQP
jgi:glycogen(starch) synthase